METGDGSKPLKKSSNISGKRLFFACPLSISKDYVICSSKELLKQKKDRKDRENETR